VTDTPSPALVPDILHALARGLAEILHDRLLGLYLGGSAAAGDFAVATSDYDFLAVTAGDLAPGDLQILERLRQELLRTSKDATRLEGEYAPRHLLIPHGTRSPVPGVFHGQFVSNVDQIMLSADNIADMRLHGITVLGPPPAELLPDVTTDDVRAAVLNMLRDGPHNCATEIDAASELLNLVRSACALESGQPATKRQGELWARSHLEHTWHPIIQQAQNVRHGHQAAVGYRTLRNAVPELYQVLQPLWQHC